MRRPASRISSAVLQTPISRQTRRSWPAPEVFDRVASNQNLDFGAILAAAQDEKPSAVQVGADDLNPEVIGTRVVAALRQMAPKLEEGVLLPLDPSRRRWRLMPLRGRT